MHFNRVSLEDICEIQQTAQGSLYEFMTGVVSFHKCVGVIDTSSLPHRFGDEKFEMGVVWLIKI